ncbi:N-acetylglucosamine-6-phosphate deacetylase [Paenibacillus spongiae]|uniref:Amidohydrolase family protein n=1 Tax=Paenibacillus spongiae TaxID=2909671 RepID=A0ABY5S7L4_9BACL|nr:amidohydrolase family protein [Paenibacillus spongiae]UVI28318.1 amidohydrolase family protein [Paenibacillus spongiae]
MIRAIHYATGGQIAISMEQGIITGIEAVPEAAPDKDALPIAAPGLVDLQINGYAGLDFNQLPMPESLLSDAVTRLWSQGVTACYPTVITNRADVIHKLLGQIARACDEDPIAARGIAGIHLEGPFISPQDGARGAHALEYVMAPDWELFCRWQEAAGGRIGIVTISPEWPGSASFIRSCADSGVTVSIGHTSATPDQIREAAQAGARMSTHLGNGAHLMLPRHPNYIWEQLAQDMLSSCVIADGFHLPDQVLKVVIKVKGKQAMLVSDAVSLSGLEAGTYTTHIGGQVVLTPEGRLHLAENEKILAGSAQMLLAGIEHLTGRGLAELAEAWDMASVRPATVMKLPSAGGLEAGAPADLVLFRREGSRIRIEQTYKGGERVYSKS